MVPASEIVKKNNGVHEQPNKIQIQFQQENY
jgi:hypothetical protein